jgi:hypothetical protein
MSALIESGHSNAWEFEFLTGSLRPEAAVALPLSAAGVSLLNGWAFDITVRTKNTAITFIGLEQFTAAFAFIEKLTGIRGH